MRQKSHEADAHTRPPMRHLLLLFFFSFPPSFVVRSVAAQESAEFAIPELDHEPIDAGEALRLGRAVRPFVVEFDEDEGDLTPDVRLVGPDDDSVAYGRKVTVGEIMKLLEEPAMNMYTRSEAVNHVLSLARVGYLRIFDEYRLGGTFYVSTTLYLYVHTILSGMDPAESAGVARPGGRGREASVYSSHSLTD